MKRYHLEKKISTCTKCKNSSSSFNLQSPVSCLQMLLISEDEKNGICLDFKLMIVLTGFSKHNNHGPLAKPAFKNPVAHSQERSESKQIHAVVHVINVAHEAEFRHLRVDNEAINTQ